MVKILEQPENQKPAMMDSSHERQSVGSSPGVCNRAGEPGTAPPKRVPGGGESNSPGRLPARLCLSDPERRTLAEIGKRLGRKALEKVACAAKPDTILAWYRRLIARKFDGSRSRSYPGRPRISTEVEERVLRFARENSGWGYDRIGGALANLGHQISDQTVGNILRRHDVAPAPKRSQTTTWKEFIRRHMDVLAGTDFFTVEVLTWRGLATYY